MGKKPKLLKKRIAYDIISGHSLKDMIKQAQKKHGKKFKVLCAAAGDTFGSAEMLVEVRREK